MMSLPLAGSDTDLGPTKQPMQADHLLTTKMRISVVSPRIIY